MIGRQIGPYEILAELGRGGMGEVYQARDTRLNRDVALKILPPALANDPDRLARFRREAQVLASLNHPNIATIHGLEEVPGSRDAGHPMQALVMELVPGRTLDAIIAAGGTPRGVSVQDALAIARQIASALEAAHEQGVVHRDLKPANVKVTDEGTVKVLDFGLAKALAPEHASATDGGRGLSAGSDSRTLTSPAMTELGMILGTAGYMAPEQAKGRPVDRRADIWALGVVLFEMLTGRPLYRGESVTETIAHVITQPPDWNTLPVATPSAVRRLLRRLLEKDPRNRLQSAGDARLEIDEYLAAGDAVPDRPEPASSGSRSMRMLPWALAAALVAVVIYLAWPRPAGPAPQLRLDVRLGGAELAIDENVDGAIAILSPDGGSIVYLGNTTATRQLYVRPLDRLDSTPLGGTEGALQHFFSHDGRSLGFFTAGGLFRMPAGGGSPTEVVRVFDPRGGTWGPDDTIVYSPGIVTGLMRVPAAGGTATEVTKLGPNERTHRWPWFLPDGKAVLFMCQLNNAAYDDGTIEAVRLDTGERKVLIRGGTFPRYVESGHLVYIRQNTLYAVRFDPAKLEVQGEPRPILSGVFATGGGVGAGIGNGAAQVALASNGTAVYLPGTSTTDSALKLAVVDRTGRSVYEYPELRAFRDPTFSRDGRRVAVRVGDGKTEHIHVLDTARGTLTKVIFEGGFSGVPAMAPDGEHMAFASDRAGKALSVYMIKLDGTGTIRSLTPEGPLRAPTSFSPDGQLLAVSELNSMSQMDLMVLSLADGKLVPFVKSPANEMMGAFSPDGRWMAYQSGDTNGVPDVFLRAYPDGGALRQVSTTGGFTPKWTKGGRELVYSRVSPSGVTLMAVDVTPEGSALTLGKPVELFTLPIATPAAALPFDASADGNRFAVILHSTGKRAGSERTHVTLLLNFFEDLRQAASQTAK